LRLTAIMIMAQSLLLQLTRVISPDVRSECVTCVEGKFSVPGMIGQVSISVLNS